MSTQIDVTNDLLLVIWKLECNKFGCEFDEAYASEMNPFLMELISQFLINKVLVGLGGEVDLDFAIDMAQKAMRERLER